MVDFKDIRIYSQFRPNHPANFTLANIGEKVRVEIDVVCTINALSENGGNAMTANYTQSVIGGQWLYDPRGQFKGFEIGDTIEHKNYIANTSAAPFVDLHVLDKASDYLIQLDGDVTGGAGVDIPLGTSIFSVKAPHTAIEYRYNFIENNEATNYDSKVDGTNQRMIAPAIDATALITSGPLIIGQKYIISDFNAGDNFTNVGGTNVPGNVFIATGTTPTVYSNGSTLNLCSDLIFYGPKTYQIGSAFIYGTGIDTVGLYGFKFTIVHHTVLTPFFLSAKWNDLLAKIAPNYFFNSNCLKSVFEITSYLDYSDPNRIQVATSDQLDGNSGWLNENFNSGITNYYIDSIIYKNPATTVIPGISFSTVETTLEITIKNTVNAPFSNNNTKFTLNFCKAPLNDTEYLNNTKTLQKNFLFDTALNVVGSASVNGDNFGTAYQVLKNVSATFISTSEVLITAKIAMDASIVTDLQTFDEARYILFVATQNHLHDANAPTLIDAATLLVDAQDFYEDLTDPGMITFVSNYLRHFETNPQTEGTNILEVFLEDDPVAFTRITVDHTGRTLNNIELSHIDVKIKAINFVTLEEVDLDAWSLPLLNFPEIAGDTFMNVTYPRPLHVPAGEIRKNIRLFREYSLDSGLLHRYVLQFPFLINWAYFLALPTASYDFFDPTEPNNGLNNDWARISTFINWGVKYTVRVKAKKDGVPLVFNFEDDLKINEYNNLFNDFKYVGIKSYDPDSLTELYDPTIPQKYILGYKNTLFVATFSNLANYPIDLSNVHFFAHIEIFEGSAAGPNGTRRISSVWQYDNDTWFISVDGSKQIVKNLITISNTDDGIEARFKVDCTKIPLNNPNVFFKIEVRLFDALSPFALARVTEIGDDRLIEDSNIRDVEA